MPNARGEEIITCAHCSGSGEDLQVPGRCRACRGIGKVIVADRSWVACRYCDGRGQDFITFALCPACGGKGATW